MRRTGLLLGAGCAAIIAATGTTAGAQTALAPSEAQQATGDDGQVSDPADIVVVGSYAESLKKARDRKLESPIVIEALSISDLNQLPDVSVADALSRLPGVLADRDSNNGGKSTVSLRGMGTALTLGTFNGREQATPESDRSIRYDQFPSELIGGATVYKSQMASIIEGGVAGTIDLSVVKPLDFKKNLVSVSVTGAYSQLGNQIDPKNRYGVRGSASIIHKSADGTFGFAVGVAARDEAYNVVRTQHAAYDPFASVDINGDGTPDSVTYGLYHFLRQGRDKRLGAVAVAEWKPSDAIHVTVDGLYSKLKYGGGISGLFVDRTDSAANTYTDAVVIGNHLVAGTITSTDPSSGVRVVNYAADSRRNDRFYSLGGNVEFSPEGPWRAILDVGYSRVRSLSDYYEARTRALSSVNGVLGDLPGQSITFDARSKAPTFSVNFDTTDPFINRPFELTSPYYQDVRDDAFSAKLDTIYSFAGDGFFNKLRLGVRYVNRIKGVINQQQDTILSPANSPVLGASELLPYPLSDLKGPLAGSAPAYLTYDFYDIANRYFGGINVGDTAASRTASYRVRESTMAGYAQLDFQVGSALTGNVGVRAIQTDDTSSGSRRVYTLTIPDVIEPVVFKNSYTDVLPSLNLTFKAAPGLQFRLGLAKAIARPALSDLNPGFQAFDFGSATAYGGNPALRPFKTKQADLTAEYYFGQNDFVAISGFYKKLDTYITTATQSVIVDGTSYLFFQPVNESGGRIDGFEVTLQKTFDFLKAPFDGFGVYANYAFVDSNIQVNRNFSDATLGLVGLSKHSGTATLFYSKGGFDARLSYNYRGDYPRVVDGGGFETNSAAGYLDAQVSLAINPNFSIVVQASNLTNEVYTTFLDNDKSQRGRYEGYGRIFYAGVRAQF